MAGSAQPEKLQKEQTSKKENRERHSKNCALNPENNEPAIRGLVSQLFADD